MNGVHLGYCDSSILHKELIQLRRNQRLIFDTEIIKDLNSHYDNSVFISAKKGLNVNSIIEKIKESLLTENIERTIKLKSGDYKGLSELYKLAEIREVKYLKSGIKVKVRTNKNNFSKLNKIQ